MTRKNTLLRDANYNPVIRYRRFGGTHFLHLTDGERIKNILKIKIFWVLDLMIGFIGSLCYDTAHTLNSLTTAVLRISH
jgi:hypothetical protein